MQVDGGRSDQRITNMKVIVPDMGNVGHRTSPYMQYSTV